jgi:hypothetical protein
MLPNTTQNEEEKNKQSTPFNAANLPANELNRYAQNKDWHNWINSDIGVYTRYMQNLQKLPQAQQGAFAPNPQGFWNRYDPTRDAGMGNEYRSLLNQPAPGQTGVIGSTTPLNPPGAGGSMGSSFWRNPGRIAQYQMAIQATPQGMVLPDWLETSRGNLDMAYNYLRGMNGSDDWWTWGQLTDDDPIVSILDGLPVPPLQAISTGDQNSLQSNYNSSGLGGLGFAPGEQQDAGYIPMDQWDANTPDWQRTMATIMNNPYAQSGAGGALTGGILGLAAGPLGAIAGAAVGGAFGLAGAAATDEKNLTAVEKTFGTSAADIVNRLGQGALFLLNKPAEVIEQGTAGVAMLPEEIAKLVVSLSQGQNVGATFQQFVDEIAVSLKSGDLAYEAVAPQLPAIGNIPAAIEWLGDMAREGKSDVVFAKPGEMWILGKAVPQKAELYGYALLNEYKRRAMEGSQPHEEIVADMRAKYGSNFSAQMTDFMFQSFADPLNIVPFAEKGAVAKFAEVTNNPTLRLAALANEGEGVIGTLKNYGEYLRTGVTDTSPNAVKYVTRGADGTITERFGAAIPKKPSEFTWLERKLAGVNEQGVLKDMSPLQNGTAQNKPSPALPGGREQGSYVGVGNWLFALKGLTPEARVKMLTGLAHENIGTFLQQAGDDPAKMADIVLEMAGLKPSVSSEMGRLMEMPEVVTVRQALADIRPVVEKEVSRWQLGETQRPVLNAIAEMIGKKAGEVLDLISSDAGRQDVYKRIINESMRRLKENPNDSRARMISGDRTFNADSLKQIADLFDKVPYSAEQFRAHLHNVMLDHISQWSIKAFGAQPSTKMELFFQNLKGVQSLLLLGMNPGYYVNNKINNWVTRVVDGVGGFVRMKDVESFFDEFGINPARLKAGVGAADIGVDINYKKGGATVGQEGQVMRTAGRAAAEEIGLAQAETNLRSATVQTGRLQTINDKLRKIGDKMPFTRLSQDAERVDSAKSFYYGVKESWNGLWNKNQLPKLERGIESELAQMGGQRAVDAFYAAVERAKKHGDLDRLANNFTQVIKERKADSFIGNAAALSGLEPEAVRALVQDYLPTIDMVLESGGSLDTAFERVHKQMQTKLDEMLKTDLITRAEDAANRVNTEGFSAAFDLFNDMQLKTQEHWTQHFTKWEEAWQKAYENPDLYNEIISARANEANHEWRNHKNWMEATYSGVFRALGTESDISRAYINAVVGMHAMWDEFFAFKQQVVTRFRNDSPSRRDDPSTHAKMKADMDADIMEAYLESSRKELQFKQEMGTHFIGLWEKAFGQEKAAGAGEWVRTDMRLNEKRARIQSAWREYVYGKPVADRSSLAPEIARFMDEGIPFVERALLWPKFIQEVYLPVIGETIAANIKGMNDIFRAAGGFDVAKETPKPDMPKGPDTQGKGEAEAAKSETGKTATTEKPAVEIQKPKVEELSTKTEVLEPKPTENIQKPAENDVVTEKNTPLISSQNSERSTPPKMEGGMTLAELEKRQGYKTRYGLNETEIDQALLNEARLDAYKPGDRVLVNGQRGVVVGPKKHLHSWVWEQRVQLEGNSYASRPRLYEIEPDPEFMPDNRTLGILPETESKALLDTYGYKHPKHALNSINKHSETKYENLSDVPVVEMERIQQLRQAEAFKKTEELTEANTGVNAPRSDYAQAFDIPEWMATELSDQVEWIAKSMDEQLPAGGKDGWRVIDEDNRRISLNPAWYQRLYDEYAASGKTLNKETVRNALGRIIEDAGKDTVKGNEQTIKDVKSMLFQEAAKLAPPELTVLFDWLPRDYYEQGDLPMAANQLLEWMSSPYADRFTDADWQQITNGHFEELLELANQEELPVTQPLPDFLMPTDSSKLEPGRGEWSALDENTQAAVLDVIDQVQAERSTLEMENRLQMEMGADEPAIETIPDDAMPLIDPQKLTSKTADEFDWKDRNQRKQALIDLFNYSPERADMEMAILDTVADTWARRNGGKAEDLWRYLVKVRRGMPELPSLKDIIWQGDKLSSEETQRYVRSLLRQDDRHILLALGDYDTKTDKVEFLSVLHDMDPERAERIARMGFDKGILWQFNVDTKAAGMRLDRARQSLINELVGARLDDIEIDYIFNALDKGKSWIKLPSRPERGLIFQNNKPSGPGIQTDFNWPVIWAVMDEYRSAKYFSDLHTAMEGKGNEYTLKDVYDYNRQARGETSTLSYDPQTLNQGPRGAYIPWENNGRLIAALEDADVDTFIHETGHYFFEFALTESDRSAVMDWAGVKSLDGEDYRTAQEKFADGYVQYRRDGRAPNVAIAKVWHEFRRFLKNLIKELSVVLGLEESRFVGDEKLPSSIGDVYQRLFDLDPWEMRLDEYLQAGYKNVSPDVGETFAKRHADSVKMALDYGIPVPADVLAEYPHLQEKITARLERGEVVRVDEAAVVWENNLPFEKQPQPIQSADKSGELNTQPEVNARPIELKNYSEKGVKDWQVGEKEFIDHYFERERNRYQRAIDQEKRVLDDPKQPGWQKDKSKVRIAAWESFLNHEIKPVEIEAKRIEYLKLVKKAISKGELVPQAVIDQYPEFTKSLDSRARYEKGWKTSFANRSMAINETVKVERGIKVKRQDGSAIPQEQINQIINGIDEVETVLGSLKDLFEYTDITIAHTNGKYPFLKTAGGLYHSTEKSISMGVKSKGSDPGQPVLAHELAHWLDFEAGAAGDIGVKIKIGDKVHSVSALSENNGTHAGLISDAKYKMNRYYEVRSLFKRNSRLAKEMPEEKFNDVKFKLGSYWDRPREIWARLMEQYIANKLGKGGTSVDSPQYYAETIGWWNQKDFDYLMPQIEAEITRRINMIRDNLPPELVQTVPDGTLFQLGKDGTPQPTAEAENIGAQIADDFSVLQFSQALEIGGNEIAGMAFKDGKFVAWVPNGIGALRKFDTPLGEGRLLGKDSAGNWVYEVGGDIRTLSTEDAASLTGSAAPGTVDSLAGVEYDSQFVGDGYENFTRPALDALKRAMGSGDNGPTPRQGSFDNGPLPTSPIGEEMQAGSAVSLSPEAMKGIQRYVNQLKPLMSAKKLASIRHGERKRDMSLLNYSNRRGVDRLLNPVYPYQFWFTRSAMNWAARVMDKPGLAAFYARLKQFQSRDDEDMPSRIKGKLRINAPYLPEWASGGVYIDPLAKLLPISEFMRPIDNYRQDEYRVERDLEYALQRMVSEGEATEEEAMLAYQSRSGKVFDTAMAEAQANNEKDVLDYMGIVTSPAMYLSMPYNLATGNADKISQLPITRTFNSLKTALGIDSSVADIEGAARTKYGLEEFGQWGDYYIDRQLANLAAEGVYRVDDILLAMNERSGPAFDDARERVQVEMMMRTPGAAPIYATRQVLSGKAKAGDLWGSILWGLLPGGLVPDAELKQRQLKHAYDAAWTAYNKGDKTAINTFFEEHPEYNARLALYDEPEDRLRQFLVSEVWDRYGELVRADKKSVENAFGQDFSERFLDKETQDYSSISVQTLAYWANALDGKVPVTKETESVMKLPGANLNLLPPAISGGIEKYYAERNAQFPDISQMESLLYNLPQEQQSAFRSQYPQFAAYETWKNKYLAKNSQIIPYVIGEQNGLAGLPNDVQQLVYQYRAIRDQYFPGIFDIQEQYYNLSKVERKAFKLDHPELQDYWSFRKEYSGQFPTAAVYILGEDGLAQAILGESYTYNSGASTSVPTPGAGGSQTGYTPEHPAILTDAEAAQFSQTLTNQLMAYAYRGEALLPGATREITTIWEKAGKPGGTLTDYLQEYVVPWVLNR